MLKTILFILSFFQKCILRIRAFRYSLLLKSVGKNFIIAKGSIIGSPGTVEIGDNVYINAYSSLNGQGGMKIGNDVLIGPNTSIWTSNHNFQDSNIPINQQGDSCAPVIIGNDVWIGAQVVVLPGVTIGNGSVIGAGSIVTKDIPDFSIAVGNPAKVIRSRKN